MAPGPLSNTRHEDAPKHKLPAFVRLTYNARCAAPGTSAKGDEKPTDTRTDTGERQELSGRVPRPARGSLARHRFFFRATRELLMLRPTLRPTIQFSGMVDGAGLSPNDRATVGDGENQRDCVSTWSLRALRCRDWQKEASAASEALGKTRTTCRKLLGDTARLLKRRAMGPVSK